MGHFDADELMDRVDNDAELLTDLVEIFVEDGQNQVDAIEAAVVSQDAKALESAAHSFKGSSNNMAAAKLGQIAFELERAGKDGNFDGTTAMISRLKEEFSLCRDEMLKHIG